jgi:hypothetical protein
MKCPGQDTRYWKPGDIFEVECPQCAHKVEFFKDEATRKCTRCRHTVVNPKMDFGCAGYCKYAADCLGELGPELLVRRKELLKERVVVATKRELGHDFRKIAHAARVTRYAEQIAGEEKADMALVLSVSSLHVLDEPPEGDAPIQNRKQAAEILELLGAGPELTGKVVGIIAAFKSADLPDSLDAEVFFDAHRLALLEEKKGGSDDSAGAGQTKSGMFTKTARRIAAEFVAKRNSTVEQKDEDNKDENKEKNY